MITSFNQSNYQNRRGRHTSETMEQPKSPRLYVNDRVCFFVFVCYQYLYFSIVRGFYDWKIKHQLYRLKVTVIHSSWDEMINYFHLCQENRTEFKSEFLKNIQTNVIYYFGFFMLWCSERNYYCDELWVYQSKQE